MKAAKAYFIGGAEGLGGARRWEGGGVEWGDRCLTSGNGGLRGFRRALR